MLRDCEAPLHTVVYGSCPASKSTVRTNQGAAMPSAAANNWLLVIAAPRAGLPTTCSIEVRILSPRQVGFELRCAGRRFRSLKLRLGAMLGRLQEMIARLQNQPVPTAKGAMMQAKENEELAHKAHSEIVRAASKLLDEGLPIGLVTIAAMRSR